MAHENLNEAANRALQISKPKIPAGNEVPVTEATENWLELFKKLSRREFELGDDAPHKKVMAYGDKDKKKRPGMAEEVSLLNERILLKKSSFAVAFEQATKTAKREKRNVFLVPRGSGYYDVTEDRPMGGEYIYATSAGTLRTVREAFDCQITPEAAEMVEGDYMLRLGSSIVCRGDMAHLNTFAAQKGMKFEQADNEFGGKFVKDELELTPEHRLPSTGISKRRQSIDPQIKAMGERIGQLELNITDGPLTNFVAGLRDCHGKLLSYHAGDREAWTEEKVLQLACNVIKDRMPSLAGDMDQLHSDFLSLVGEAQAIQDVQKEAHVRGVPLTPSYAERGAKVTATTNVVAAMVNGVAGKHTVKRGQTGTIKGVRGKRANIRWDDGSVSDLTMPTNVVSVEAVHEAMTLTGTSGFPGDRVQARKPVSGSKKVDGPTNHKIKKGLKGTISSLLDKPGLAKVKWDDRVTSFVRSPNSDILVLGKEADEDDVAEAVVSSDTKSSAIRVIVKAAHPKEGKDVKRALNRLIKDALSIKATGASTVEVWLLSSNNDAAETKVRFALTSAGVRVEYVEADEGPIDQAAVTKAAMKAAQSIHGKPDMKIIRSMVQNAIKKGAKDTEDAIQIVINMMRSKEAVGETGQLSPSAIRRLRNGLGAKRFKQYEPSLETIIKAIQVSDSMRGRHKIMQQWKLTQDEMQTFQHASDAGQVEAGVGKPIFSAPTKDGKGTFQVLKRDTSGMPGKQDKVSMRVVDKNGKVTKDWGSHVSLKGAQKFARNKGLIEAKVPSKVISSVNGARKLLKAMHRREGKDLSKAKTVRSILASAIKAAGPADPDELGPSDPLVHAVETMQMVNIRMDRLISGKSTPERAELALSTSYDSLGEIGKPLKKGHTGMRIRREAEIDTDAVRRAAVNAAKDIHGKPDLKIINSMIQKAKGKAKDTEDAVQIVIDMMRAGATEAEEKFWKSKGTDVRDRARWQIAFDRAAHKLVPNLFMPTPPDYNKMSKGYFASGIDPTKAGQRYGKILKKRKSPVTMPTGGVRRGQTRILQPMGMAASTQTEATTLTEGTMFGVNLLEPATVFTAKELVERIVPDDDMPDEPLAKTYVQYMRQGNVYLPFGKGTFHEKLLRQAYRLKRGMNGIEFHRAKAKTDELYRFENSVMESVIKEIDRFWDLKEDYAQFGVMHNRGILLEGPPGTGKSSVIQQIVEMMVQRGDVVFFSDRVSLVKEALKAFKEVEEDRAVVVVLEDADEHIKYEQNEFLQLLDGDQAVEGVLYLATTNYVENFPPRLRRPGRFDKIVHVGPPPFEGRFVYLKNKIGKVENDKEITRLANLTKGLSFGHLRELVTAAYALKEPKDEVLARITSKIHGGVVEAKKGRGKASVDGAEAVESIVSVTIKGDNNAALARTTNSIVDALEDMPEFCGMYTEEGSGNSSCIKVRMKNGNPKAACNLVMKALEAANISAQNLTIESYTFQPSYRAQRMPAKDAAAAQATSAGPVLRSRSTAGSSKANEKGKKKKGNQDPFSKIWREVTKDPQATLDKAQESKEFRGYLSAIRKTVGRRVAPIEVAPYFTTGQSLKQAAKKIAETAPDDTPFSKHGAKQGQTGPAFQTDAQKPFKDWMKQVDREVGKKVGISAQDLPDVPYADWHDDGMNPKRAAAKAIKMAKESATERRIRCIVGEGLNMEPSPATLTLGEASAAGMNLLAIHPTDRAIVEKTAPVVLRQLDTRIQSRVGRDANRYKAMFSDHKSYIGVTEDKVSDDLKARVTTVQNRLNKQYMLKGQKPHKPSDYQEVEKLYREVKKVAKGKGAERSLRATAKNLATAKGNLKRTYELHMAAGTLLGAIQYSDAATEAIGPMGGGTSTTSLVGPDHKIIQKGTKKKMLTLLKKKGGRKAGYYLALTSKGVGQKFKEATTEAKFRAKWDFNKASPANWHSSKQAVKFGKDNEGFVISAPDEKAAKDILKKKHKVNPFYVKLTKESVGEGETGEISQQSVDSLRRKVANSR